MKMYTREFCLANILEVRVGTTGPQGGDAGHGCRTVFELRDLSSTSWTIRLIEGGVRIDLLGDCELATFVDALQFAADTLRAEQAVSKSVRSALEKMSQ